MYLGWDSSCRLMEMFWPTVGLQNHLQESDQNRLLIWRDGHFLDLGGPEFLTIGRYQKGMGFLWHFHHRSLPLEVKVTDYVDPYLPLWSRTVEIPSNGGPDSPVAIYAVHSFALNENTIGEEAAWDPKARRLYHFKGKTWIAVRVRPLDQEGSLSGDSGRVGDVRVAVAKMRDGGVRFSDDSGDVAGQTVDHGFIQSALGLRCGARAPVEYTLACGEDRQEVDRNMDAAVVERVRTRSKTYWQGLGGYGNLPEAAGATSLKIVATHCDQGGGIIASCDTGILGDHRDHYRYVWPRDAAMCASALLSAGFPGYARRYLEFCGRALSPEGCFWQRYRPDGSRGSGWHPWDLPPGELPIQEDETALSLITAGDYLDLAGNLDALNSCYSPFVRKAADFILNYRDEDGLLVKPSYDLWEERRGVFSFTQAACSGGLMAASRIAYALGREGEGREMEEGASDLRRGLALHLSTEDRGFCRSLTGRSDGDARFERDWTDDSSLFLIPLMLPASPDPDAAEESVEILVARSAMTWRRLKDALAVRLPGIAVPGYARYAGDWYQRPPGAMGAPGNPWPATTAWFVLSGLRLGLLDEEDIQPYLEWFDGVSLESGVFPEQVSATDGGPLSVAPLAWSHAMHLLLLAAARAAFAANTPASAGEG